MFAALGDPTRAIIVEKLVLHGPASVTRLAEGLVVTRQAVTKHLRVLSAAGIVRSHRNGKEQVIELEPKAIADASAWLTQIATDWDSRLDLFKKVVEDP